MTTALIAVPSVIVYLAGWTLTARFFYLRWRPSREVLKCRYPTLCRMEGKHDENCYKKTIYSPGENQAQMQAMLMGVIWPAAALVGVILSVAFREPRHDPAPAAAIEDEIVRLERELGMNGH